MFLSKIWNKNEPFTLVFMPKSGFINASTVFSRRIVLIVNLEQVHCKRRMSTVPVWYSEGDPDYYFWYV